MRLGIRAKLFLISLGLITISVVAADILLTRKLAPLMENEVRKDLLVRLNLIERAVSHAEIPLDRPASWDALADSLGTVGHVRVTIIRKDGVVLGDSEVEGARLPEVENHAGRPEVKAALASGQGSSKRWSDTLHEQMLYLATPFGREGSVAGVVRAAMPLIEVRRAAGQFRTGVLVASLLALAATALMSGLVAQWISRSVRSLTSVARRMAEGDLTVRTPAGGQDEVAQLGRALNTLGTNLGGTLDLLRTERDLEDRILTNMQEGVILLGDDGRVVLVNPALRAMLLLTGEYLGRSPLEVIRNAAIHTLFDRARRSRAAESAEIDVGGLKPRRLLVHAVPLSGAPGGLLAVFVDVTELRRLETIRRDFVANVSHELRTPVAAIRSAAETMRVAAADDPETAATLLTIIERNAERMGQLVQDLLDLSRIEAKEFHFHIEPVEVAPAGEHVVSLLRAAAEAKRIRLISEVPGELSPVAADRKALEQILTNLVENAIKHSPAETTVTLGACREEGWIRISVRDTGPGIEERHLPRLFERFYRVDAGRSREVGGTGLGLAIVKHLVEGLGGSVGVQSTAGVGSVFSVSLRVADS